MKRTIIILLIAASVAVTWYINSTKTLVADDVKAMVDKILAEDPLFPARPVWWNDDKILVVGILPDQAKGEEAAQKVCSLLLSRSLPLNGIRVEIYDLIKIKQSDDWTLLGTTLCKTAN